MNHCSKPSRRRIRAWCVAFLLTNTWLIASGRAEAGARGWVRHVMDASFRGADGVRMADVNRDGRPDVVTGWEEGGVVRAYLQPENARVRQPWPAVTVGTVASPEDAVFADLDQDGAMDVVSSCEGQNQRVFVHWAPRDAPDFLRPDRWTTQAFPGVERRAMWMFAVPADLDGGGGVDLVLGSKGAGAMIGWLQAPAQRRELANWKFHSLCQAGWIMSLICVDLDRDGDLDILASDRKGSSRGVWWLENPGGLQTNPASNWRRHRVGATHREVMFLDLGDLDGDKLTDVVVAVKPRAAVLLCQSADPRQPWRERELVLPPAIGTAKAVAIGDLDGDGRSDVVFSCEEATNAKLGVVWFPGANFFAGNPPEVHNISGPDGTKFDRMELVDLDADGDLDVITTEETEKLGVIWYENPRKGVAPAPKP